MSPSPAQPTRPDSSAAYRFGAYSLWPEQQRLCRDNADLALTARAFAVLLALVEQAGDVVTKEALMQRVWAGLVVEENNLAVQVGNLRKLLGSDAIATVAGRGYRFAWPVARTAASVRRRHNLPAATVPLLGRDEDLAALLQCLQHQRLVTVVGAGGIGKSRLAQAASREQLARWRDGVWWVELAGLADAALLALSVAQTLGVSIAEREAAPAALGAALGRALADHEALLVIDNCEHLLQAVAALADTLLRDAPGLRLLATSQEPLRLAAEQQFRLNPLAVPRDAATPDAEHFGALVLLVSRVRAVAPDFALDADTLPLAVDLCRRLDGLPLAIELAAARIPLLGLRTVHDRLDERFRLLTAGSRTALRRHQTLRAAMDWSHSLLDDGQRALFMQLGVFSGGFTLALAQELCSDDDTDAWAVLENLAALVDKSLVVLQAVDGPQDRQDRQDQGPRYRLLESARAFALEHLAAAGQTPHFLRRHADTMLRFLSRVDDSNMDGELRTDEYAALVLPEIDNLRAAYAWADGSGGERAIAIGLAAHVGPLIDYSLEFVDWMLTQRQHVDGTAVGDATAARFWRGIAASNMFSFVPVAEVLQAAQRSVALYRRLGWPKRIFSGLRRMSSAAVSTQDFDLARRANDEAERLLQPHWGPEFHIGVLRGRGHLARLGGNIEGALQAYGEAVRLARDVGADWRLECIDQTCLADVLWQAGRHAEAASMMAALVARMQQQPASDFELVDALETWLLVLSESAARQDVAEVARQALPALRRMPRFSLAGCAHVLLVLGRARDAARVLGACAARLRTGLEVEHVNLQRLHAAAHAGIAAALPAAEVAALAAAGEGLSYADVCSLLEQALLEQALAAAGAVP